MVEIQHTNLSKQAVGAVMMALQKSLMEQSDIVPVLENFKMATSPEGLVVLNPPTVKFDDDFESRTRENLGIESPGTSASVDPFEKREN
tara:strand:+ start:314 stop:580 length:267 start_codon:yes stop_codon:yes gene_type:complete